MANLWGELIVAAGLVSMVIRELVLLRRLRIRRDSVERLASSSLPGSRLIDQDRDGSRIEILVGHLARATKEAGDQGA